VNAIINGSSSTWTLAPATSTLADIPVTVISTWTEVNISSLTFAWDRGNNPASVTLYAVDLSTVSNFIGGTTLTNSTLSLDTTFTGLNAETIYYARVKAINHSGIDTGYLLLGSTTTKNPYGPTDLVYSTASTTSLTATWTAPVPAGQSYTLQVSTNNNFGIISGSVNTGLTNATISALSVNTTYYGRVNAIINGSSSTWTLGAATATLADVPVTVSSTWTEVNISSLTFAWDRGNNPASVTLYSVDLSTVSNFIGGTILTNSTLSLDTTFTGLNAETVYYARVKAINHSGIHTEYLLLGSTTTKIPYGPTNLVYSTASITSLTATWTAPVPAGQSYTLQVSTDNNFGVINGSVNTGLTNTTISALSVNTTYYGRVNAIINGSSSTWTLAAATATLADIPVTVVSTWTEVNISSLTFAWDRGNNPASVTLYSVDLSTVSNFIGGTTLTNSTLSLDTTFTGLNAETVYYARVKAINHSGIDTSYLLLGSTVTKVPYGPTNLVYSTASITSLTATWTAPVPAGQSYTFQVSTNSNFALVSNSVNTM
jgi:hypothetical protein